MFNRKPIVINLTINSNLEKSMSALTDALTALGQQIASLNPAGNADHLKAIDDHLAKLDASTVTDEATIADTAAGLQALITAANGGTPSATPAPTPAPTLAPAA